MALKNSENIQIYVDESVEHLADIESDLLLIEKNGAEIDLELVNKVFRTAHSIKGGAGFLGFSNIKELAHKMENVLGLIRSRKLVPDSGVVNLLLNAADRLSILIDSIDESNTAEVGDLVDQLQALAQGEPLPVQETPAPKAEETVTVPAGKAAPKLTPEQARQTEFDQIVRPAVDDSDDHNTKEGLEQDGKIRKKSVASFETSLRVNINLLDTLMTLAGELVLSRNQLLKALAENDKGSVEYVGKRIDLITSDLQESVMLTRMQPIGKILQRFPRQVRDQARNLGKDVELTLEGEDVEVDKTIIEAISDPLTHLVRNAIDHGIELPATRRELGKESTGKVMIRAFHEAGLVCLEVQDDGKGLDADLIAREAVARGQISAEMMGQMSEKEKLHLIFAPGFSMAKKVTEISGRGVGMDVVKTNLDQLGSQIEIVSIPGHGTTFRIKIPLTLAIISSQIVLEGEERYAFPQVNLLELIRIPADQVKHRVEIVGDAAVLRLRGHLLPLLRLSQVLGTEKKFFDPEESVFKDDRRHNVADRRSKKFPVGATRGENTGKKERQALAEWEQKRTLDDRRRHRLSTMKIALVDTGFLRYGLIVDMLLDSEEIVVKPLGQHLKHINIFSGATIMGDGRVALILDVAHIAREAGLTSLESTDRFKELMKNRENAIRTRRDIQDLLIFRVADHQQFAVPLSLVQRIIKVQTDQIEDVGGKRVIKYQERSLTLCAIDQVANVLPLPEDESYLVLIFNISGREIGMLARMPVNAVEITMADIDQTHSQPAIMGSIIIDGQITLLVNIYDLVQALYPDWVMPHGKIKEQTTGAGKTILFAEDSEFFREQVSQCMEEEGFKVIKAEDGEAAWKLLKIHHAEIGLVVSDIEMPKLDGFGLAERIKHDDNYNHLPVVALTTLASAEDRARGEKCGFSDYLIKLDKDKLLESIYRLFRTDADEG